MSVKIGINGFGRIGRMVFRALAEQGLLNSQFEVALINDLAPADNLAYLLKYDSIQGRLASNVVSKRSDQSKDGDDIIIAHGQRIPCLSLASRPGDLPWREFDVKIVIEATGIFAAEEASQGHLDAGAEKVIISAPAKGNVKTVVMGVNDDTLTANDDIISNASCTTNCLAPLAKVVLDAYGIEEGLMTTVHSYTATQKTTDGPSFKDWKGGRAAGLNIIPSSTGAAKAVGLVIPELQGKLTGIAFRVPTPTVSVVDLTVRTVRETKYREICTQIKKATTGSLRGILGYTEDEVVSTDFIHDPRSSIFDATAGMELNSRFFKLVSWYDNEWGYANRCANLLKKVSTFI